MILITQNNLFQIFVYIRQIKIYLPIYIILSSENNEYINKIVEIIQRMIQEFIQNTIKLIFLQQFNIIKQTNLLSQLMIKIEDKNLDPIQYIKHNKKKYILRKQQKELITQQQIDTLLKESRIVRVQKIKILQVIQVLKRMSISNIKQKSNGVTKAKNQLQACSKFMNQPNQYIVKIYDIYQTPLYYNIQMQWCNNQSLEQYLLKDKIANQRPQLSILIFLSILYSITICNQKGIIHRDIKPENILINLKLDQMAFKVEIKLCDFGICSFQKNVNGFQGTILYLAPQIYALEHDDQSQFCTEQFQHQFNYNSNCDIFSLGVISYQLNNGLNLITKCIQFPFGKNISKRLQQEDADQYQLAKQYYLDSVNIDKCLNCLRVWNKISAQNKQRMQKFRQLIRLMLEPYPKKRVQLHQLYKKINQNRKQLFYGLEMHEAVRNFDIYYKKSKKIVQQGGIQMSLANTQLSC